jgi:hypothetical protein
VNLDMGRLSDELDHEFEVRELERRIGVVEA